MITGPITCTKRVAHHNPAVTSNPVSNHVIVCGLRHVGLRLIEQLHGAGEQVVVIDDHHDLRLTRLVRDWDIRLIEGSARRLDTLLRASVETAAALVCAENEDLENLDVALLARRIRPDLRVVLHLTNPAVGRALTRVTGPAPCSTSQLWPRPALSKRAWLAGGIGFPSRAKTSGSSNCRPRLTARSDRWRLAWLRSRSSQRAAARC